MLPIITAFKKSPDKGRGFARDIRVRWALEEVGQPYEVRLVTFEEIKIPAYRKLQPFGQIPIYQEGNLVLFESGAIIMHLAQKHAGLLPVESDSRSRAICWIFCALNTIEPLISERGTALLFETNRSWFQERMTWIEERIATRLKDLSAQLDDKPWLENEFSAGDLLMVTILRRLAGTEILQKHPNLTEYIARAESRPAFQRAFQAQLDVFKASQS